MAVNVILLILGLVICFGGIYFKKVSAALLGLIWGILVSAVTIALIILSQHGLWALGSALDDGEFIAIVLIIGIVVAAISAALDRLCAAINAFLSSLLILFLLIGALVDDSDAIAVVIVVSVALAGLVAYLAYVYHNYAFIIVTAFSGAFLATLSGMAIAEEEDFAEFLLDIIIYGNENAYLTLFGFTLVLGLLGFFVQRNRLLQMQGGQSGVVDTVKPVDLTQAKDTAEKAIEQAKNVGTKVGETIGPAANTLGTGIKNAWEEIKAESKERNLADELKQDWILFVPVLVNTIVCNLIWMFLRGSVNYIPALYTATNWLAYISAGMAAAVMVYFILTKDIKMNLLYLIPWIVGFLAFNASYYYETTDMLYPLFRIVILWVVLYVVAIVVKKDSIKPVLLSALYLVLHFYLLDKIAYEYYSYYFDPLQLVFLAAMIGFLYWLMKNRGVNIFSFGDSKGDATSPNRFTTTSGPNVAAGVNQSAFRARRCPKCKTIKSSSEAANFCSNCGTELEVICSNCGSLVQMTQRYCIKCGRELKN